jgi:hypothetical protein
MNIWLSLMFVALLSKRDRKRVAGRTWGSGGNCVTCKTAFCYCASVISYIDIGIATSDNFIEHSQDVITLFQSCRIGCGSYEDEMILNGWLGYFRHKTLREAHIEAIDSLHCVAQL